MLAIFLILSSLSLYPESFRTEVEGVIEVFPGSPESPVTIGINSSVIINLGQDARFLRGIEIEITAPQNWLPYRGALAMMIYNNLNPQTASGITDVVGSRIAFEPLPSRLRIVYHVPVRNSHGLRTTTTVSVPSSVALPATFPIMLRLAQVTKGQPDSFENMKFTMVARSILSDEGAIRIVPRYPSQLKNKPFTLLINDNVVSNIADLILLKEGEHHLVILSEDYRNESRRFVVERGRVIDLTIDLQDPTPTIIFEGPQNSIVFLDNSPAKKGEPVTLEPGPHEIKFQVGDYTIIRTLNVQRGKTYKVALAVDLTVQEED
jgi:hypothetical protein